MRGQNWVSKSDVTQYLRCPYAFYLLDSGEIQFAEAVTEQQARRIDEGVDFHGRVEADAIPRAISAGELQDVYANEAIRLFNVPVFENHALSIYGQPDAIDTGKGAMVPIEVKSHKDVQRSDEVELAFYWLLLEPLRTKSVAPHGYVLLRRGETAEAVKVDLGPHRFEQVRRLIEDVRASRISGVQPRVCGCPICSTDAVRGEVERATLARKDHTRIWGIGRAYASHLEAIGINNYEELASLDAAAVSGHLHKRRCFVSPRQVASWKHHAMSYATSLPVRFGSALDLSDCFIALDLEYGPGALIWLIGVCVVSGTGRQHFSLWAESPGEEKRNLERLAEIVAANPALPIVTWNGNGAEMPQLRAAAERHNASEPLESVESRHADLYAYAKNAVRFPIPQLGLKEVACHLAVPRLSRIRDGLEAQFLFEEHVRASDQVRRDEIKASLVEYNRDDVEALVATAERLRCL